MKNYGVRGPKNPYRRVKKYPTRGPQDQLVNPAYNNGKGPQNQKIFDNVTDTTTNTTE